MLEDDAGSGMAYARAARSGDENAIDPRDFDADEPLTPVWTVPHAVFRRRLGVALKVDFRRLQEIGDQAREYWIRLAQICGRGRMINEDLVTLGPSERPAVDVAWPSARRGTLDRTPHSSTVALSAPAQGRRFRTLEKPISNLTEDRRPHLLVAVPWLPYGGAEMLLFDVLQRLARDWRLSIVTTLRHAHDMAPQFATLTADIFHLADMIAPSSFLDFLVAFARSRRAAVLLSSNLNDYYEIANELKARLPSLVAVDILHNDAWHLGGAVKASAALDRHVAVSHRVAASLVERGVPKKRIVVIPNGVDVDGQFSPGQINRDALRQSFNLRPDAFVVTYVGRLAEEKRPDAFLEIVELLRHTTPVEALMVGEGPLSEEIALTIRQQQLPVRAIDQVERQRVHEIYAVSDLLIVPSKIEGMPLVVLEALAMGCPVAATAAGDLKRVVVDGYNGYLVPVGDFRALVPIIRELAGDPRQQAALRSAARASVRAAGATLETMVTQYVRLLSDLTTRGR
jgi:glycosyltransferase involved in cell wall biosynthesis